MTENTLILIFYLDVPYVWCICIAQRFEPDCRLGALEISIIIIIIKGAKFRTSETFALLVVVENSQQAYKNHSKVDQPYKLLAVLTVPA